VRPDASSTTTTVDGRITAPVLVDARWLARHRDGVVVLDTRSSRDFAAGHVPGARSFPLDALLVDDSSRPALARLAEHARTLLAARGVSPTDHVVLIDGCDGSAALGAAVCELAGLRRVSVVQGAGIDAWRTAGGTLVAHDSTIEPSDAGAWAGLADRTAGIAAFEDLVDAVVHGTAHVVDARSQLEHEGIVGSPCCGSRGAIPGSVHLEWTACFDMLGEPRDAATLRAQLAQVGIEADEPVVVACHAGHRAAITARVLRAAGIRNVRVSLGSWHEWCGRGLGSDERDED
jgi:thiosulfate/3-mercaptopyruvate sulfurtransferase